MRLLVTLLCIFVSSVLASPQCAFMLKGASFDLSGLKTSSADTDYVATSTGFAPYTYKANICGDAHQSAPCSGAVCQYNHAGMFISTLGRWGVADADVWSLIDEQNPNAGVRLTMKNGDMCFGVGLKRISKIDVVCTPNTVGGPLTVTDDHNGCMEPGYRFSINSCHGCPGGCSMVSAAGVGSSTYFLVFVIFGGALYLVMGCAYNRKYGLKEGEEPPSYIESIPNIEFWKKVPGYLQTVGEHSLAYSKAGISKIQEWREEGSSDQNSAYTSTNNHSSDKAEKGLLGDGEDLDDDLDFD